MRRLIFAVFGLLFLSSAPASAQEPTLVVENGRVITGTGTVLERGTVVVAGERIMSVSEEPISESDARRVDASGKTVLPGLIDAHVHLLVDPRSPVQPGSDYRHRAPPPTTMSDSLARAYLDDGFPQKLRSYLEAGVTTVRSTGDYWPEIVEAQARVSSGELTGPRLEVVGPVFTAPGGHPSAICRFGRPGGPHAEWCLSHLTVPVDDPGEAREWVRRVAESGVDAIKMVGPEFGGLEDDAVIRALAAEAESRGIPALMHISDRDEAFQALSLGIDQFVHAPFVASDTAHDRLMLNFMRQGDVFTSSTISIQDLTLDGLRGAGLDERAEEEAQEVESRMLAARIYAQEGLLAFGTDVPMLAPEEGLRREIRLLQEAGLEPAEVIRSMTLTAARALKREQDLGTLETGKLADLIVVEGNPLEDLSALLDVEVVVQSGTVVVDSEHVYRGRSNSGRTPSIRDGGEPTPRHPRRQHTAPARLPRRTPEGVAGPLQPARQRGAGRWTAGPGLGAGLWSPVRGVDPEARPLFRSQRRSQKPRSGSGVARSVSAASP